MAPHVARRSTSPQHPFGELLSRHRARKPGLTQKQLAELAGYDQAILTRMGHGRKDLTGPSGRERVVRLIETLADHGALGTLEEANALLSAAGQQPLFDRQPGEARLITRLPAAPAAHRARRTNLPAPLSSFIGRAPEIADVRRLLGSARVLTLTGVGGSGKTRLAQRAAADVLDAYTDGVWLAELAAFTEPMAAATPIADVVARALDLIPSSRSAHDQVLDHLRGRHALLVLDNCEHMLAAAAAFVVAVLRACPQVTVLATSREALNVNGETAWRVPPMRSDEAEHLFVTRAAAARGSVTVSQGDDTVAHICQRLDGMPLAIELAAAQMKSLSLSDIAARLADRFGLLTNGRRDALPRHQTLRALIDWSHDLLSEAEKTVLRQLGVFAGGWELAQAQRAAGDGVDVQPILAALVDKSLVSMDVQEGVTRYRCLETIREYGLDKLRERDDLARMQRRHAQAFLEFAEQRWDQVWKDQASWMRHTRANYANFAAALAWCFGPLGDPVMGCQLTAMMVQVWDVMGVYQRDGRRWFRLAYAALGDEVPARARGWLYLRYPRYADDVSQAQQLVCKQKAYDLLKTTDDSFGHVLAMAHLGLALHFDDRSSGRGLALAEESVVLARATRDDFIVAIADVGVAILLNDLGEFERAGRVSLEVIELAARAQDRNMQAMGLMKLAITRMQQLQFAGAIECLEKAVEHTRSMDDPVNTANSLAMIAENLRYLGDVDGAVRFARESLREIRESLGAPLREMHALSVLCKALADAGEREAAGQMIHAYLGAVSRQVGAVPGKYSRILDAAACLASHAGDHARAARLFGAADADLRVLNRKRGLNYDWEYAPIIATARAALGDAACAAAYAEGGGMSLAQAIAYARASHA